MVKFDATQLRYLGKDEFRVLTAVEMGMRNHELVPKPIIASIAGIRGAGAFRALTELHKNKLVWHSATPYDGFKLTYLGYDFLALHTFEKRGLLTGVGRKIGTGKESDIFVVTGFIPKEGAEDGANAKEGDGDGDSDDGGASTSVEAGEDQFREKRQLALKLHRLGRTSFKAVKSKRDYLRNKKTSNWLYLSRLAAAKEFAFMKVLHDHGFPVPIPVGVNRHAVLMELVKGTLLENVTHLQRPGDAYELCMDLIVRLASHGLIHCDCNEFNIILREDEATGDVGITLIDFPQMVSTSHANAEWYFDRDVECIRTFFRRRFGFESERYPIFAQDVAREGSLDIEVSASGYTISKEDEQLLESATEAHCRTDATDSGDQPSASSGESGSDDDDDEEGDEEGEGDDDKKDEKAPSATKSEAEGEKDEEEEEEEEGEEEEMEEGEKAQGPEVDMKQLLKDAKRKVGVKHRAPVKKLGHPQKGRQQRAMRHAMRETDY